MSKLLEQIDRIIRKGKKPVKYPDGFRLLDLMQLDLMRKRAEELDSKYLDIIENAKKIQKELDVAEKRNSKLFYENKELKEKVQKLEEAIEELNANRKELAKKSTKKTKKSDAHKPTTE